eukprot:symbB.v1.2.008322.t1/scaffold520.1/size192860/5
MVPSFGEYPRGFAVDFDRSIQEQQRMQATPAEPVFDDIAIRGTVEAATWQEVERRLSILQNQPRSVLAQAVAEAWRMLLCRRRYAA